MWLRFCGAGAVSALANFAVGSLAITPLATAVRCARGLRSRRGRTSALRCKVVDPPSSRYEVLQVLQTPYRSTRADRISGTAVVRRKRCRLIRKVCFLDPEGTGSWAARHGCRWAKSEPINRPPGSRGAAAGPCDVSGTRESDRNDTRCANAAPSRRARADELPPIDHLLRTDPTEHAGVAQERAHGGIYRNSFSAMLRRHWIKLGGFH